MSRGQQILAISHAECLQRASAALRAAGYSNWGELGNGSYGDKGPHSASIFCEVTVGDKEVVDIVVATEGTSDSGMPGAERETLQRMMAGAAPPPPPPPPVTGGGATPCGPRGPEWTDWFNTDAPDASGDHETRDRYAVDAKCNPSEIECCAHDGRDWRQTGQSYVCDLATGGRCLNAENNGGCLDYHVRFRCGSAVTGSAAIVMPGGECSNPVANGTTATSLRGRNGEHFTFCCPKDIGGPIYGTDIYTDDSSICAAAVHAGSLSYGSAGMVTIEIRPGQSQYVGSNRQGNVSQSWSAFPGSFVVVSGGHP